MKNVSNIKNTWITLYEFVLKKKKIELKDLINNKLLGFSKGMYIYKMYK